MVADADTLTSMTSTIYNEYYISIETINWENENILNNEKNIKESLIFSINQSFLGEMKDI